MVRERERERERKHWKRVSFGGGGGEGKNRNSKDKRLQQLLLTRQPVGPNSEYMYVNMEYLC